MKLTKKHLIITILILIFIGIIQIAFYDQPLPEQYVEVEDKLFAYETYGEGDNIIIAIHGSPGSKEDFIDLGPFVNHTTIYAIDMIGFGESSLQSTNYGFEKQAMYLKMIADKLGISQATYLGYSWGGLVVTQFTYDNPEYVDQLILLGAVGVPEGSHTENYFTEQLRYIISFPFVILYPGSFAPDLLHIGRRHGFIRSFGDGDQRNIAAIMQNIQTPTLIIHGNEDHVVELKGAQIHNELLQNSTLRMYNGTHGAIFSQAEKIAVIINEELR